MWTAYWTLHLHNNGVHKASNMQPTWRIQCTLHIEFPICMDCLMPTCSVQIPHRVSNMLPVSNLRMEYLIYTCSARLSTRSNLFQFDVYLIHLCLVFTFSIQYAVHLKGLVLKSRIKCSMPMVPLNLGPVQLGPLSLGPFISSHLFRPT